MLAMTHNHFCLLCFYCLSAKRDIFGFFLPTDLNTLGFYFLILCIVHGICIYLPQNAGKFIKSMRYPLIVIC